MQAGSLEIGERLQTLSGDVKVVQQKLPRPGPEPVFNLEVHAEHVYFIGEDGVLVHNAYDDILIDNNILSNVARGDTNAIDFMTRNRGKLLVDTQVKLEFIQGSTRGGLSGRRPIDLIHIMNEYGIRSVRTASRTDALAVMAMNSTRTVLRDDDFIVATATNLGVRFASGDKRATITAIRNGMDARYFNFSEGNVVHRYAKAIRGPVKTRIVINSMAGKLLKTESERRCSHVDYPVHMAETTSAEYDRVQDGPKTIHF